MLLLQFYLHILYILCTIRMCTVDQSKFLVAILHFFLALLFLLYILRNTHKRNKTQEHYNVRLVVCLSWRAPSWVHFMRFLFCEPHRTYDSYFRDVPERSSSPARPQPGGRDYPGSHAKGRHKSPASHRGYDRGSTVLTDRRAVTFYSHC